MAKKESPVLTKSGPSSNWLALQKSLPSTSSKSTQARKKRKLEHDTSITSTAVTTVVEEETDFIRGYQRAQPTASTSSAAAYSGPSHKNGESVEKLREMIAGELAYSENQQQPGKYLAIDCEMVGVGIDGKESSLARVSMVNYFGAIQMDEFVKQRERVVDYRTEFSGIRPSDMVKAKPFLEVQQQVAELIKDRILVGHAIHNDLKCLLLSHPRHLVRDTQVYAGKHKVTKSRRPALRMLVKQELGVSIQEGEHSSVSHVPYPFCYVFVLPHRNSLMMISSAKVTDARATMAVYRLHRKDWDKGAPPPPGSTSGTSTASSSSKKKRKTPANADADNDSDNDDDATSSTPSSGRKQQQASNSFPGGGRKGVSSGLSTIIKQRDSSGRGRGRRGDDLQGAAKPKSSEQKKSGKTEWWKELGGSAGAKGSMSFRV
ncbi:3'-5' exonuclease [Steccherinum ochraceum]|uniref:RNA exonuclease 4 n=1 Tax=Steccherinum ochraceum TaxID=92696 RepID=A0A4V2MWJ7_9APHY|nr:3'-5' exonuclease [Steccherinum ochraceum]